MLHLERIEISGFKSFVDPVRLTFPPGVTGIVGPNGCGKSNLSEAITWVLGEQSAKTLRGDKMEDVIFNGSERRKPLGLAEVTMTLRTDAPMAHAEEGKVTLTRRVFRDGDSQYKINGKNARLKDIKDVLMDTGLGIRAYSVIEQGRIGMILSGKPQERRRLIEEAAGITRYKTRKRLAEVKLEETTANLLRLADIIAEVERAMRSLKRQAQAAQRYKEKEVEHRELLVQVLGGRWSRLSHELTDLSERLAVASDAESELAATIARNEAGLAVGRETLDRLVRELAAAHERASSLSARIEGRQEFAKARRVTLTEVRERTASSRELAADKEKILQGFGSALEVLKRRRVELEMELEQAETAVGSGVEKLAGAEEVLRGRLAEVEERRRELLALSSEATSVAHRAQHEQLERERGTVRLSHLGEELDRARFELKTADEQLTLAHELERTLHRRQAEKAAEIEASEQALATILEEEGSAGEERRRLEGKLSEVRQRWKLLSGLAEAHQKSRAALERALDEIGLGTPAYLAERLSAVAGWEHSLDFFLGLLEDAVLVPADEASLDLARALRTTKGPRTVLAHPLPAPAEGSTAHALFDLHDPAIVLSLAQALALPPELAATLPPAYLVQTAEDAERLAHRYPGPAFLSSEGIWAQGGLLHLEGERTVPGVLERERELADLSAELPDLELALAEAIEAVEALVARRAEKAKEAHRLSAELGQLKQESAVAAARRQDLEIRRQRFVGQVDAITKEHETLERQLASVDERRAHLLAELARAETRRGELTEALDLAQQALDLAKGERENLRAENAGVEGRRALARERLASHEREVARLEREQADGQRQIQLWRDEAARLELRSGELVREIDEAERELAALLGEREGSEQAVLDAQAKVDAERDGLKAQQDGLNTTRERYDTARRQVEALRIQQASLTQESGNLGEQFREKLGVEPPDEALVPPVPELLAELEQALVRSREALERLGPVNALAAEEYSENEQRYEFLTQQRADVEASIESLKQTIKEINETSSVRFQEVFAQVNQNFGEIFQRLFRGGEAEMRLLDEEDLLESGIEIVARPPGKRLQNIMLMSGGEKALTAIALLFALFRTKPSPFCILDEVDAPLDDANAVRFVEMLKEMSSDTQFIIITHNKISMRIAHRLYGVTMEERGVSKVVGVAMEEVQPELAVSA